MSGNFENRRQETSVHHITRMGSLFSTAAEKTTGAGATYSIPAAGSSNEGYSRCWSHMYDRWRRRCVGE